MIYRAYAHQVGGRERGRERLDLLSLHVRRSAIAAGNDEGLSRCAACVRRCTRLYAGGAFWSRDLPRPFISLLIDTSAISPRARLIFPPQNLQTLCEIPHSSKRREWVQGECVMKLKGAPVSLRYVESVLKLQLRQKKKKHYISAHIRPYTFF